MRIVAGRWRGRTICTPVGRGTTRPTTDRTREAIASMICSALGLDLEGVSVLDAFAGSGAVGIELVSRGAARAVLIDRDRRACSLIKKTIFELGATSQELQVVQGDAQALSNGVLVGAPFDVVFLDPPYAMSAQNVSELVNNLIENDALGVGALVVYEHDHKASGLSVARLSHVRGRRYGMAVVDMYVVEEESA